MTEVALAAMLMATGFWMTPAQRETRPPVDVPEVRAKAVSVAPRTSGKRVTGTATYYAYHRGQAAAGPGLRRALGSNWRGRTVVVNGTLVVRLTDWCACKDNRVIDLDKRDFSTLAPTWRGVIPVVVTW
jgi:rare lipoprotein A (peptidoglycan hydrolase)